MSAIEHWRPIPGWEGVYEVSDAGRVRSLDRRYTNARGERRTYRGRVLSAFLNSEGYPQVNLSRPGTRASRAVHQLVALAFIGPPLPDEEVCHGDGTRTNNALTNLRYGTHSENALDQVRHGTHNHAHKTHCLRGHEYVGMNLILRPNGERDCRTCGHERNRAYRRLHHAATTCREGAR